MKGKRCPVQVRVGAFETKISPAVSGYIEISVPVDKG